MSGSFDFGFFPQFVHQFVQYRFFRLSLHQWAQFGKGGDL